MNSSAPLPAVVSGVKYGADTEQNTFVYGGRTTGATSVILIHGGAWSTVGQQAELEEAAENLQAEGFCVFRMNYRLVGKKVGTTLVTQVEDVELMTKFVEENAATYKGSTTHITMVAGSSGGNVGPVGALKYNAGKAGAVKVIVTLSGIHELKWPLEEVVKGETSNKTWTEALPQALGDTTAEESLEEPFLAIANANSANLILTNGNKPQAWQMFNSSNELVNYAQQEKMKAACEAHGVTVAGGIPSTGKHSFVYWSLVEKEVIEFLRTYG